MKIWDVGYPYRVGGNQKSGEHQLRLVVDIPLFIGFSLTCLGFLNHQRYDTLLETNSLHLKMDGWKTTFLLGRTIFRGKLLV